MKWNEVKLLILEEVEKLNHGFDISNYAENGGDRQRNKLSTFAMVKI